jgi:hypothetical protein
MDVPDPTNESHWQKSEPYGARVLQEKPHLRHLPPTLAERGTTLCGE